MSITGAEGDGVENFRGPALEYAKSLVEKLQSGSAFDAVKVIENMNELREKTLFEEVGRLTRRIHNAIVNFHIDMRLDSAAKDELSRMADATDRLNYVIRLTEGAANKTMDGVEQSAPMAKNIANTAAELHKEWGRLMRREMKPEEFRNLYKKIDAYLVDTEREANDLHSNLSEMLLAQDYQDLTGQVIKRVITLVQEVEASLVDLVRMASTVEELAGLAANDAESQETVLDEQPEGPVINSEQREDVVANQDEVDDLLSSLGF